MRNEMNTTNTNGMEQRGTLADVLAYVDRRAAAWLATRLVKGRKERFCEVVKITPAMASALLDLNTHNRPLSPGSVKQYAGLMMGGMWRLTTEGIAVSSDGVLTNGQHRLAAVVESGVTVPMTVWFGCAPDEFEVVDQGHKRGAAQVLALKGYENTAVMAAMGSLIGRMRAQGGKAVHAQEAIRIAEALAQKPLQEACTRGMGLARVTSPTAAALAYWHILTTSPNASRLPDFWDGLTTGAGLYGVKLALREWLMNGVDAKRHSQDLSVKKAAAIILTWNAWLAGKKRVQSLAWNRFIVLPDAN